MFAHYALVKVMKKVELKKMENLMSFSIGNCTKSVKTADLNLCVVFQGNAGSNPIGDHSKGHRTMLQKG